MVFLPSFSFAEQAEQRWQASAGLQALAALKQVFWEPREASQLEATLQAYSAAALGTGKRHDAVPACASLQVWHGIRSMPWHTWTARAACQHSQWSCQVLTSEWLSHDAGQADCKCKGAVMFCVVGAKLAEVRCTSAAGAHSVATCHSTQFDMLALAGHQLR